MTIPYDLIYEILYRVPVKYLLGCRCVSKGWCSLIDSTEFVKKHIKTSIECNNGGIIIRRGDSFYLADYESLHEDVTNAIEIDNPVKSFLSGADLVGSANGLVCCYNAFTNTTLLLNPCTMKCKTLPMIPYEWQASFYQKFDRYLCGFAYDHLSDDYKVVQIAVCHRDQSPDIMVVVYSLKTNSWTHVQNVRLAKNIYFESQWGRFASGALYWPANDMKEENTSSIIVRFDLGLEQITEYTDSFASKDFIYSERLVAIEGSLHIIEYNSRVNVSQINDFGMRNPRFKVPVDGIEYRGYGLRPLAYSKSRQEVLIQVDFISLIWYHLESEAIRNVIIQNIRGDRIDSHSYTESLFQFPEE